MPAAADVEDLTIRELFALPLDSPSELAAGLKEEDFQAIRKTMSSLAHPIAWSDVQSQISSVLSGALNTPLLEAWAHAWKKFQDVKRDAEESRKSPGAVVLSKLADHSIESVLHPYVEVLLGSKAIQKIVFDVTLTTEMQGLLLSLRDGCIVSIKLAKCEWSGSIATQKITLIKRSIATLDVPGSINLKRPISLIKPADG